MYWYLKQFKHYGKAEGRASRKEFWMFTLFHMIVLFIIFFIMLYAEAHESLRALEAIFKTLYFVYVIASFVPSVCVYIRRFHDCNKSGFWYLAANIPFVNLYVFYLTIKAGDKEPNQYGNVPSNVVPAKA